MPIERITIFCFGASYAVALVMELAQLLWPRPAQRVVGYVFGAAGLLAHTLFLAVQRPPLSHQYGSLLALAWVLAVFSLSGSIHRRVAWAVFVLPLVLGLIGLAEAFRSPAGPAWNLDFGLGENDWSQLWGMLHGGLVLLAAVGVCVAFLASIMYLVQAHRLKTKVLPQHGLRVLSLEELEGINRHAINLAFPLLTAGVLVGFLLMFQPASGPAPTFFEQGTAKIIASTALWLVFALLLYLRYSAHLRGRRLAVLTIFAFGLLLFALASSHPAVQGGGP